MTEQTKMTATTPTETTPMPGLETGPRIHYAFFKRGKTRVAAAFTLDEERESHIRKVEFGYAFCRKGDRFLKKTGRNIAEGRMLSRPHTTKITLQTPEEGKTTIPISEQVKALLKGQLKGKPLEVWYPPKKKPVVAEKSA